MPTTSFSDNDNSHHVAREPDAHGQAALLLIESLIHGLIAQSTITVGTAMEIIDIAVDVQRNTMDDRGDPSGLLQRTITLLQAMNISLKNDFVSE